MRGIGGISQPMRDRHRVFFRLILTELEFPLNALDGDFKSKNVIEATRYSRMVDITSLPPIGVVGFHPIRQDLKPSFQFIIGLQLDLPIAMDGRVVVRRWHVPVWIPRAGYITVWSMENREG